MKKLDPKFFITCGVIILIPIMILIVLFAIKGCNGAKTPEKYEELMVEAAEKYAKAHKMFPKKGKQVIIKLDELEKDGLKSSEKALKDTTCSGSVTITNTSNDLSDEKYYLYTPYLECSDYKTDYLKDHLLEDLTTTKSGLYKIGEEYVFKGDKVNNYITFYGVNYRIVKIDENNNLKLIKTASQEVSSSWDNKYNINNKKYSGINSYADSNILDRLKEDYKKDKTLKNEAKSHIIPTDVCIGKRSTNNLSKNITNECSEKIDNQIITLPSVTDIALASYDENCNNLGDLSCTNYNYLADFIEFSWTVDSAVEDTSLVYYISSSDADLETANKYKKYNWVIYISGDEIYKEGSGTEEDPYIIK